MLKKEIIDILSASKDTGWVLEPQAKRLMALSGLHVPNFSWVKSEDEALRFAEKIGYPVVSKIVSPKALHKSDVGGVISGIENEETLKKAFKNLSAIPGFLGVLIEEMASGLELILGAKVDYQFGPVILLGMGGTGVEVYKDTVIRMAPLDQQSAESMIHGLKARELLKGYRGAEGININLLIQTLITFSRIVLSLEEFIESVDLNPVFCSPKSCILGDARIILK